MSSQPRKGKKRAIKKKKTSSQKPVQLTIASYGKKRQSSASTPTSTTEEDPASSSASASMAPIIVSLPVTNAMETRFNTHNTLDSRLTDYRPDLLLQPPDAVSSRGAGGFDAVDGAEQQIVLERCEECAEEFAACEKCLMQFNEVFARSLSEMEAAREIDDQLAHPDASKFENKIISEEPLGNDFQPPNYVYKRRWERSEGDQGPKLEGYQSEWCPGDAGDSRVQRPNRTSEELSSLRREIMVLRNQLASSSTHSKAKASTPKGPNECWWHLAPFSTPVVGLPLHYDEDSETFESVGCFCSLPCVYAYRLEHRSAEAAPLELLFRAYRMIGGKGNLVPSPPRQALIRFGGTMTLSEFLSPPQHWYRVSRNPFVPSREFVEEESLRPSATRVTTATTGTPGLIRTRDKAHPNAANQWGSAVRRSRLRRRELI